jgi:hypothetical protein
MKPVAQPGKLDFHLWCKQISDGGRTTANRVA